MRLKLLARALAGTIPALAVTGWALQTAGRTVPVDGRALVTYDGPAGRLTNILKTIGGTLHMNLGATGDIGDDVYALSVKDMPLESLTSRIEKVSFGTWKKTADQWVLSRDREAVAKLEQQDRFALQKAIAKQLKDNSEQFGQAFDKTFLTGVVQEIHRLEKQSAEGDDTGKAGQKRRETLMQVAPVARAFWRAMRDVDLAKIAAIPIDHRIVYSNSPIGRELPLGKNAEEAITKLQEEQAVWGPVLKANSEPGSLFLDQIAEGNEGEIDDDEAMFFSSEAWQRSLPYKRKPVRMLLRVSNEWYGTLTADILLLDAQGKSVAAYKVEGLQGFDSAEPKPFPVLQPKEITVSAATQALKTSLYEHQSNTGKPSTSLTVLRPFVATAETNDPLEIAPGPMLREAAKTLGLQLVAWVPDDTVGLCIPGDDDKVTDKWVLDKLGEESMQFTEEGGVLVGEPRKPVQAMRRRIDRTALGRFARTVLTKNQATIDDWLEFQTYCGEAPEYGWANWLCDMLVSGGMPSDTGSPPTERLYGVLTPQQKAVLRQGRTVAYRELTGIQRDAAETLVFGTQYSNFSELGAPDGRHFVDPCEELPTGLLATCGLSAKYQSDASIVFLDPAEKNNQFYRVTVSEEGGRGFWTGPPPQTPKAGLQTTLFQVCPFEKIDFSWEYSPGHVKTVYFRGPFRAPLSDPVPLDKLPEPYRTCAKKGLEFLKTFGKVGFSDGGGQK